MAYGVETARTLDGDVWVSWRDCIASGECIDHLVLIDVP